MAYPITARRADGSDVSLTVRQTLTKSKQGTAGAAGAAAQVLALLATAQSFKFNAAGAASPASQTISFTAVPINIAGTAAFTCTRYNASGGSLGTVTLGGGASNTRTLTEAQFGVAAYAVISATLGGYTDQVTVVRLQDGVAGQNAVLGFLTNEAHTVATAADGSGGSYAGAGGTFKVFNGTTDVTTSAAFSVVSSSGITGLSIGAATGIYTLSGTSADTGTATLRAVFGGVTIDRVYTISRSKQGSTGSPGLPAVSEGVDKPSLVLAAWSDGVVKSGQLPVTVTAFAKLGGTVDTANWTWSRSASAGITTTISGAVVTVTAVTAAVTSGTITITGTRSGYSNISIVVAVSKALDAVPSAGVTSPMGNHGAASLRTVASGSVTASSGVELRADGTIYARTNTSGSNVWTKRGDWYLPTGSPGASYEVLFEELGVIVDTTGTGGTVAGVGVWYSLSSTRIVTLSYTSAGEWLIRRSFSYTVRRTSDDVQVGSGTITLGSTRAF